MKKAKCPECGKLFSKRVNYACPFCEVPLDLTRVKEGKVSKNVYVRTHKKAEVIPEEAIEVLTYIVGSTNVVKVDENHWQVYICEILPKLVCPNCRKIAVHSPQLFRGNFSHQCHNSECRHFTVFNFLVG